MRIVSLVLLIVSLVWSAAPAQQLESSNLSVAERDQNWYFRVTVGALANLYPTLSQPAGFAHLTLGLSWSPNWLLTPQVQVTKVVHEFGLNFEVAGKGPKWVFEIVPLVIEFEVNPRASPGRTSALRQGQSSAQPEQQSPLDLRALVLARWDEVLKASEQLAKDNPGLEALREPLTEFKKAFDSGKMDDAAIQLDTFSVTLLFIQRNGLLTKFQEMHLRTGLHRLVSAFALFREQVQRQKVKVCTGLFVSEDQKSEEVLSPLLTEMMKKLTFTNRTTGAKETFTLKESRCF